MYRAPFYRQILPWLFVLVFLILAPLLLFYTAGYRYNSKKGQVERNGALIVDSLPKGAMVWVDDTNTGESTPITLQNVTPGSHTIRLVKAGYHSWEKRLEVNAQRVTFASQIQLWRQATPSLAFSGAVMRATEDPLQLKIALVLQDQGQFYVALWAPDTQTLNTLPLLHATSSTPLTIRWDNTGQAFLLNGLGLQDSAWWGNTLTTPMSVEPLPAGLYYWSDQDLVGTDGAALFRLTPRSNAFQRERLGPGLLEEDRTFRLEASTSTQGSLVVVPRAFGTRVFSLPAGNWRVGGLISPYLIFKNQNHWLAMQPDAASAYAGDAQGDVPRWLHASPQPMALLLSGNELMRWNLGEDATLLWRQGEPLVQAVWHPSGGNIFVATKHQVFALELDDRSGRLVTPLAEFEEIHDLAILKNTLLIAGTKNHERGLWSLEL